MLLKSPNYDGAMILIIKCGRYRIDIIKNKAFYSSKSTSFHCKIVTSIDSKM